VHLSVVGVPSWYRGRESLESWKLMRLLTSFALLLYALD
jgi:hypothetical protein